MYAKFHGPENAMSAPESNALCSAPSSSLHTAQQENLHAFEFLLTYNAFSTL